MYVDVYYETENLLFHCRVISLILSVTNSNSGCVLEDRAY